MLPRGASHYVFEPEFCNPAAGWEKGQIEKNVRDARSRMWQIMPVFKDLDALNQWLEDRHAKGVLSARRIALWAETKHRELPGSITDVWEAEKPLLMALPPAFDGFVEHSKRVSPTCLITFERNRYSVPASFANRRVSLHVYPERLMIVAEGLIVCTHDRIIDRSHRKSGRVIYDWRHYLAVIQRKPGALRNGAPFTEMPEAFRRLQSHMLPKEGGGRDLLGTLLRNTLSGSGWSISCLWYCTTTKALFCRPSNWHWRLAYQIGGWRTNQDARSEPPAQTDGPKADRSSRDRSP